MVLINADCVLPLCVCCRLWSRVVAGAPREHVPIDTGAKVAV